MAKKKSLLDHLIGYFLLVIVFSFIILGIYSVYMYTYSPQIDIAKQKSLENFQEIKIDESIYYERTVNTFATKSLASETWVTFKLNTNHSKEEVLKIFDEQFCSLGWEKKEENLYRRNIKEWVSLEYEEHILYVNFRVFFYELNSDAGMEFSDPMTILLTKTPDLFREIFSD